MNLSSKNLQKLVARGANGTGVSIYIPTHPSSSSQTLAQDTIRFKNALKQIKSDPTYNERELGAVIESLYVLAEDVEFWKRQDVGLALFADSEGYEYFTLPYETTEAVYVAKQFIISPLAVMHSIGEKFYVLDINLTKPRLLASHHGTLVAVNQEAMPGSFEEQIAGDEYKVELQHMNAPRGSGGDNSFHGHDVDDAISHEIGTYLALVAKVTDEYLVDNDHPLMLVGEQSRVGNLRSYVTYEHLLVHGIDGNFESSTPQDLYNAVIETMQSYDTTRRRELVDHLLSSAPEFVVMGYDELSEAANVGRVERVYIPSYKRTTDSVRPGETASIVLQLPDDINKLESVTRAVLAQSGSVLAVEIGALPELTDIRGLCRY